MVHGLPRGLTRKQSIFFVDQINEQRRSLLYTVAATSIKTLKPAAHLRKEPSKLPREAKQGNQLSFFFKSAVEFS